MIKADIKVLSDALIVRLANDDQMLVVTDWACRTFKIVMVEAWKAGCPKKVWNMDKSPFSVVTQAAFDRELSR